MLEAVFEEVMLYKKAFPEAERITKVTLQNPVCIKDEKNLY